jgi:hypothetical protein
VRHGPPRVPRTGPFFVSEITLPNTSFDTRLASESTEAFHAFSIYRDLGLKRNLDEVSRRFDAEKRGSISRKEHERSPGNLGKSASGPANTSGSSALRPGIASSTNS